MTSITCWQRIEPQSRSQDMADGLQAQVRDPLWMLARQWQVGESTGHDAGSPVQASFQIRHAPLTGYSAGSAASFSPIAVAPLEVQVEGETVNLGVRIQTQLGVHFETLLQGAGQSGVVGDFRTAYPVTVPVTGAYDDIPDSAGSQYQTAVYGRVTNGWALYVDAKATLPGEPSQLPASAQATFATIFLTILQTFVGYVDSLYWPTDQQVPGQPPATPGATAWSPQPPAADGACDIGWLDYSFSVESVSDWSTFNFSAKEFPGGHLDWYSFSVASDPAPPEAATRANNSEGSGEPVAATVEYRTLMPTHVTFKGMPAGTYWSFEDGMTDFGQLSTNLVDLPSTLIAEFSVLYGGDWFSLPVQLPFGTVSQIAMLIVTDTFGQRTLIRPTATSQPSPAPPPAPNGGPPAFTQWSSSSAYSSGDVILFAGQLWWSLIDANTGVTPGSDYSRWAPWQRPWSVFTVTGEPSTVDVLLVPPVLGFTEEGPPLERVDFFRDDAAALAWGVERTLQGALDAPVDAYEWYLKRFDAYQSPGPPTQVPGEPTISYLLGTSVPDNWIPLVPVQRPAGDPQNPLFRRGVLYRMDQTQTPVPVPAHSQVLLPAYPQQSPLFLADQAIPQAGIHVERYFRRARWIDGSTQVWMARRTLTGKGPGASGLAFDLIQPFSPRPRPEISTVNPSTGPAAGGTGVVISGKGFLGATAVMFGSSAATSMIVDSDMQIAADSPSGSGVVQVTVVTPSGVSPTAPDTQFTYV